MEKRGKMKIIIPAAVVVLVICVVVLILVHNRAPEDSGAALFPVYFFDAQQGRLVPEMREVPQDLADEGGSRLIGVLWHELFYGVPRDGSLSRAMPEGMGVVPGDSRLFNWDLYDGVFTLEVLPMTTAEEAVFRSAVTLTMAGLSFVDSVEFVRPDGTVWTETAASIANAPFISPVLSQAENFTLFFVCESGEGLFTVVYEADDVNLHMRSHYMLELLISGQNAPGVMPLIPPETRVHGVLDEEAGIYIDLSAEFYSRFAGTPAQARLMLQSIAHTILENNTRTVRRVFFLLESDRREEFHGVPYFHQFFTIDETVMVGYEPPPEDPEYEE